MNYEAVRTFLKEADILPSKQMGQNFLTDETVCQKMVEQLQICPEDTVVEVGPGAGSITQKILASDRLRKLILIEFDERLADQLLRSLGEDERVTVIHADAAQFDTRVLFAQQPVKLIGNLPFSAGGAIMKNFLDAPSPVSRAVLMLQKEVVDRLTAVPRTKDYGVLSVRMQSRWDISAGQIVPPEALHPRPRIDSAITVLTPRKKQLPVYDLKLFDSLLRRAFSQRRKQMAKQMPDHLEWSEAIKDLDISPTARAEELSLELWVELTRRYDDHPLKDTPQKGSELFDVVDENDVPVRTETREVVHRDDLLHRAVHIFIFNKHREMFLQKRSRLKDKCPSLWDSSAAGHLDAGGSYEETATRELKEELDIEVPLNELAYITPSENTGWEFIKVFGGRHDGAVRYPASEVETGMWLGMSELQTWVTQRPQDFAPGFIECWIAFTEKLEIGR